MKHELGIAKAAVHDKDGKFAVEKETYIVGKLYYTESTVDCL